MTRPIEVTKTTALHMVLDRAKWGGTISPEIVVHAEKELEVLVTRITQLRDRASQKPRRIPIYDELPY